MKVINKVITISTLMLLLVLTTACAKPQDLDTPCPNYGRQCSQVLINTEPLLPTTGAINE